MSVTTMLERAAGALWEAARHYGPTNRPSWHDAPEADKEMAFDLVRAVLMAVRDVPVSLLEGAAKEVCGADPLPHEVMNFDNTFAAMIDAILNEGSAA